MTRRAMQVGTEGQRETLPARAEALGRRAGANLACGFRPGSWRHLRVAWDSRRDRVGLRSLEQRGFALLEVLIAGIVVGITILGVSLMLTYGSAFTVSQGTSGVELNLAEQKLEKLRTLGFTGTPTLGPDGSGASDKCPNNEPCYKEETLQGGAVTNGRQQSFTRLTCVDYVSDNGPPYPEACPSTPPGQPACWSDPSGGTLTCTKRVRVTVQPRDQASIAKADSIVLEMILVNPPKANP